MIGFDIEHQPYHGPVPENCELVLQDVCTLHGSQFRNAACIVASPPCQKYSWMAQPWSAAKREAAWQRWERQAPIWRGQFTLNDLFDACFRIQREASEASGHQIPLIVENVIGAQPWVGRAVWHYGSYYLWGDVPILMPHTPYGRKVPGNDTFKKTGEPGGKLTDQRYPSTKITCYANQRDGFSHTRHLTNQRESDAIKVSGAWFGSYAEQKAAGTISPGRLHGSRSDARRAASAEIAMIPFELSSHIARVYKPR